MEILIKLLTVLGLGAVSLWAAIPAGLALQLGALVTGITSAIGAILGVLVILVLGERIRRLMHRNYCEVKEGHRGRMCGIRERYGVAGLGLLAPLLVGAPLGTVIGIILGSPRNRLMFWMSLGIVIWSAVSTLAIVLGIGSIEGILS